MLTLLRFLGEVEELFSGRENDPVLGQKSGYDSANPLGHDMSASSLRQKSVPPIEFSGKSF